MFLKIGVGVTAVDGTIGAEVHERVQKVRNLIGGKIRRLEVAVIDTPKVPVSQWMSPAQILVLDQANQLVK